MPLDDAGFTPPQAQAVPKPNAYDTRWSVIHGRAPEPRAIIPLSDAQALLHIWHRLATNWSRKYNDGDDHCIVGWVGNTCSPCTVTNFRRGQVNRLLKLLHAALPKSAQRKGDDVWHALAKYNDSHSVHAVRAVVYRAYLAEVNARVEELNRQPVPGA